MPIAPTVPLLDLDGPGLPVGLTNSAPLSSQVMRLGVPHRSGRLAFHAFNTTTPSMVSASAFWNSSKRDFDVPENSDLWEVDFALDSAGFTAMSKWKRGGPTSGIASIFPWTLDEYIGLVAKVPRAWFSAPDLCCEPEICSSPAEVTYRVEATATLLEGLLRRLHAWHQALAAEGWSCAEIARLLPAPVPVLQGRTVFDYRHSLDLTLDVWRRWTPWLQPQPTLIGVGSMCRRPLHDRREGILAVVAALEPHLPPGSRLHLFGVKGAALCRLKTSDSVASFDSMAFDFSARVSARTEGVPNTMARRSAAMSAWASKASAALRPCAGDQLRLL